MSNLLLRNIPDELHTSLKEMATRSRRSLNQEILYQLETLVLHAQNDTAGSTRASSTPPSPDMADGDNVRRETIDEVHTWPREAQGALAAHLLSALDDETDPGAEAAWAAEISRRLAEIGEGTATLHAWSEVREELLAAE